MEIKLLAPGGVLKIKGCSILKHFIELLVHPNCLRTFVIIRIILMVQQISIECVQGSRGAEIDRVLFESNTPGVMTNLFMATCTSSDSPDS